jgi:molybdopterin/thiamine biosynthesis adenylyltransferase
LYKYKREILMLSDPEKRRYSRHIMLPEVGEEGQEKIKNAKVLVVGAGGLELRCFNT